MGILYLAALVISLTGMVVIDRRWRLFLFARPVRAVVVLAIGVTFFVVWDLAGIGLGIFFRGETAFMTGLLLAPELPIEELFFLTLLCYLTMVVFCGAQRVLARPRSAGAGRGAQANANPPQGGDS